MKNKPYVQEPEMPGPGTYQVKTFVQSMEKDSKMFTLGPKCDYAYRKGGC